MFTPLSLVSGISGLYIKKKKSRNKRKKKKNTSEINSNKSKNYKTLINFRIHTP